MEIKLDSDAMASIASAAIFDSLSQDMRDSVIKQAVEALLTPQKERGFGYNKTPLQNAFDQAIREAAFRAVKEKVQGDPVVQEAILQMLGPLLQAAMSAEAEKYDTSLADALGAALGSWLSDKARGE